jgi:FkbM family methyltransferase
VSQAIARKVTPAPVWALLRRLRRRWELARFEVREVTHRFGEHELTLLLTDPIAEAWYDTDWESLPEIELLRRGRLQPGARVFDLGAHQAVVALLLARAVGDEGFVLAVEASSHNAEVAEVNRSRNGAENMRILQAAVADRSGTVRFADYFDGFIDEGRGLTEVPAVTVDGLAGEHSPPDVVFCDVEGAEALVLAGAQDVLGRAGTDWYVEIHADGGLERLGGSREDVFASFPVDRYDVFVSFGHFGDYAPYSGEPELQRAAHALVALTQAR